MVQSQVLREPRSCHTLSIGWLPGYALLVMKSPKLKSAATLEQDMRTLAYVIASRAPNPDWLSEYIIPKLTWPVGVAGVDSDEDWGIADEPLPPPAKMAEYMRWLDDAEKGIFPPPPDAKETR